MKYQYQMRGWEELAAAGQSKDNWHFLAAIGTKKFGLIPHLYIPEEAWVLFCKNKFNNQLAAGEENNDCQ